MDISTKKRMLSMMKAISAGVTQLALLGVLSPPAHAQAYGGSATVYVYDNYQDYGATVIIEEPYTNVGTVGNFWGGGGGSLWNLPWPIPGPNDRSPNKLGKDCATAHILSVCAAKGGWSPMSLQDASKIQNSGNMIPEDVAKADCNRSGGNWDALSTAQRLYAQLMPTTFMNSNGTINIYVPANNAGDGPLILNNPTTAAMWQKQFGFNGGYGSTWKAMLCSSGATGLAAALDNGDAAMFVALHEMGHAMDPALTFHPDSRNETSFFDPSTGLPATADGVALMSYAAIIANREGGSTYNAELQKLADKLHISNVTGSKAPAPDC